MARIERTVFISYRRTNFPWALAVFQDLTQHGYDVFFDFAGLASGDFETVILANIHARAHFLVLLTPSALERCGDPGDWLRREIEAALDSERNIVPLMLEGFDFGTPTIANQLTGKLASLNRYNALEVRPAYVFEAMSRLREKYLNVALDAVPRPASSVARQAATEQKAAAATAPPVSKEELTALQWFERGFAATDPDEIIRFNSEAIRLQPDYASAYYNRGLARYHKGDLEGALADYNQALRLRPDDPATLNNRGLALADKGDFDGALADYNQALGLRPDDPDAFINRGLALADKGDFDGALADYNQALRLRPDDPDALNNRGLALADKGDLDGALADYNQAMRLQPDDPAPFNNRAILLLGKGDLEAAILDCNQAIRLRPNFSEAFDTRGDVRRAQGDLESALADYDEAIRLSPPDTGLLGRRDALLKAIVARSKS